jgi:adenylate cyclase
MVECIQRQGGMLDKFVGDAMMAIFGLPIAREDDEDRAVRAAIATLQGLAQWNVQRISDGKRPVDIGVGLNTDMVVSGSIGSPKRMDYTVIGDGVNLASLGRVQAVRDPYPDERVHLQGATQTTHPRLDRVLVIGKSDPVGVYEVLDYHTDASFRHLREVMTLFRVASNASGPATGSTPKRHSPSRLTSTRPTSLRAST